MNNQGAERIIVALDGMGPDSALRFSTSIPNLIWVKVGLELFVAGGPAVIAALKDRGKRIFLDLKFHDIPATMAAACRQAGGLGVDLLTVHASAGSTALAAARAAVAEGASAAGVGRPGILAVTVLTSWEQQRFGEELRVTDPIQAHVCHLAQLAAAAGIDGCVCSPQELTALRALHPEPFALVTPGIRPPGAASGDQARVMTPAAARAAGASQLVIGRPITLSSEPSRVFESCCRAVSGE